MKLSDIHEKFLKFFQKLFNSIKYYIIFFLDTIVNGENYKYYISIILFILLVLSILIINFFNTTNKDLTNFIFKKRNRLFINRDNDDSDDDNINNNIDSNISNIKNNQIIILSIATICIFTLYFFLYRNNHKHEKYAKEKRRLLDTTTSKFIKDNYNNTIYNPITNLFKGLGSIFLFLLIPIIIIGSIIWLFKNFEQMFIITQLFLGILIILFSLGIAYKVFDVKLDNCSNNEHYLSRFICYTKKFIFFIPCLITIIIDELTSDVKNTPNSILLLFFIEIILISLFIYVTSIFNKNTSNLLNDNQILELDVETKFGNYQNLDNNQGDKISNFKLINPNLNLPYRVDINYNNNHSYKYSYGLSFYVYLIATNNSNLAYTKESNILNYANKPLILYNGINNTLVIKSKTQNNRGTVFETIYKTKNIKYQKWFQIIINYDNNIIDVFIDGKLVGSKKNVPPYFNENTIIVGENNGIYGSIKDIHYYDKPIPMNNTKLLFDLTKN